MQHEGARTGPAGTARRLLRAALGCVDWTVTMRGMVVLGVPFASVTAVAGLRHGVFAALGAYSDAYGSREPYARRLLVLTVTAAGFVTALVLGMLAARDPWLSVAAIAVIATAGDFGTGALRMSGPRGYIFTLVGTDRAPSPRFRWRGITAGESGLLRGVSDLVTVRPLPVHQHCAQCAQTLAR